MQGFVTPYMTLPLWGVGTDSHVCKLSTTALRPERLPSVYVVSQGNRYYRGTWLARYVL